MRGTTDVSTADRNQYIVLIYDDKVETGATSTDPQLHIGHVTNLVSLTAARFLTVDGSTGSVTAKQGTPVEDNLPGGLAVT